MATLEAKRATWVRMACSRSRSSPLRYPSTFGYRGKLWVGGTDGVRAHIMCIQDSAKHHNLPPGLHVTWKEDRYVIVPNLPPPNDLGAQLTSATKDAVDSTYTSTLGLKQVCNYRDDLGMFLVVSESGVSLYNRAVEGLSRKPRKGSVVLRPSWVYSALSGFEDTELHISWERNFGRVVLQPLGVSDIVAMMEPVGSWSTLDDEVVRRFGYF